MKPKCIDCGVVASTSCRTGEIWTISEQGWLCDSCWRDSWNNDICGKCCHYDDQSNCGLFSFCPEIIKDKDPVDEYVEKYNLF